MDDSHFTNGSHQVFFIIFTINNSKEYIYINVSIIMVILFIIHLIMVIAIFGSIIFMDNHYLGYIKKID
jgi:hypothetical protein